MVGCHGLVSAFLLSVFVVSNCCCSWLTVLRTWYFTVLFRAIRVLVLYCMAWGGLVPEFVLVPLQVCGTGPGVLKPPVQDLCFRIH